MVQKVKKTNDILQKVVVREAGCTAGETDLMNWEVDD